jgi:hypothetical protein
MVWMVTDTLALAEQPLFTVTLQVPLLVTVMVCVVSPVLHAYVDPVLPASKVTVPPHWVTSGPRFTSGSPPMVTDTVSPAEQLLASIMLT